MWAPALTVALPDASCPLFELPTRNDHPIQRSSHLSRNAKRCVSRTAESMCYYRQEKTLSLADSPEGRGPHARSPTRVRQRELTLHMSCGRNCWRRIERDEGSARAHA